LFNGLALLRFSQSCSSYKVNKGYGKQSSYHCHSRTVQLPMFSSGALLQTDRRYQSASGLSELRSAGLSQPVTSTAKDALTWQADRPSTPDSVKRFQHYARQPPGAITRRHGLANDDVCAEDKVFGCKSKASKESAAECMQSYPDSEIGRWKLEQSETVYSRCACLWMVRRNSCLPENAAQLCRALHYAHTPSAAP
jgi:hypothetical protein